MIALAPDPPPHSGHRPVTIVPYVYVVPARDKVTGERLPSWFFRCTVHVNGTRRCVLFAENLDVALADLLGREPA